jgi:hypothetical protein
MWRVDYSLRWLYCIVAGSFHPWQAKFTGEKSTAPCKSILINEIAEVGNLAGTLELYKFIPIKERSENPAQLL